MAAAAVAATTTTSHASSCSHSPSSATSKLSTEQVFDRIRPLLCAISSVIGESSGFFLTHTGTLLTVANNIQYEMQEGAPVFKTELLQIESAHRTTPYYPRPTDGIIPKNARALDLYSLETEIRLKETDVIPLLPDNIPLLEGTKVYFAGYPFGQNKITFHKGTISSITQESGIRSFTIDGTVVPGNFGGPVVVQHEGKVYLVGVITSEIADLSPEDRKTIAIMKAASDYHKTQAGAALRESSAIILDDRGVTIPYKIKTLEGTETVSLNTQETIALALDLIQRNLSTGIGKAIDIRCLPLLRAAESSLPEVGHDSFPARRGKALISGTLVTPDKTPVAQYVEVRYGKSGLGNRGVRIIFMTGVRITFITDGGPKPLQYKFSPNPHTAPGSYNKNQKELYSEAAAEVLTQLIQTSSIQESVTFDACGTTYTATLESGSQ